jgi:molybdopterin converting factor small subunit
MKVRVKLFAVAKEMVGRDELTVEVREGSKITDVRRAVETVFPALRSVTSHALWAIGAAYADEQTPVNESSEIALIPPVSGG